jgi:hypothetical protein
MQEIGVDLILMRRAQAVGCAFVDLKRRVFYELGRQQSRIGDWHDLIAGSLMFLRVGRRRLFRKFSSSPT